MELLQRIESLVAQGPQGQDGTLRGIEEELRSLQQESKLDMLEQALQILGTAVGQESRCV